jgi:hypothetical protein
MNYNLRMEYRMQNGALFFAIKKPSSCWAFGVARGRFELPSALGG